MLTVWHSGCKGYLFTDPNHGIAPTIRVRDWLMGTDKWGHFFQQGWWLFNLSNPSQGAPMLFNDNERLVFSDYLEGGGSSEASVAARMPSYQGRTGLQRLRQCAEMCG